MTSIPFRRSLTSWYQSREEDPTDLCWSTGPLPGCWQDAWQAPRESGFPGPGSEPLSHSGCSWLWYLQVQERCVPAAAWVEGTQLHGFHLEKPTVWQPLPRPSDSLGTGLGTPGSLSGYWKEKMSAWQLKRPKNGNLSCCLIWKNLILFWWVFFLISCL